MSKNFKPKKDFPINDELDIDEETKVRITGDFPSVVVKFSEAKQKAEQMGLDLIGMNFETSIPILKIASYSKMIFDMKKAEKKVKPPKPVKEIDLSVNIASNDMEVKVKKTLQFIDDGHKVKVVLNIKGRERTRMEASKQTIKKFIEMLGDSVVVESLKDENNKTIAIIKKK